MQWLAWEKNRYRFFFHRPENRFDTYLRRAYKPRLARR